MVVGAEVLGDLAGGGEVGRVWRADGEGLEVRAAPAGRRDRRDERRVQPAGEEHADRARRPSSGGGRRDEHVARAARTTRCAPGSGPAPLEVVGHGAAKRRSPSSGVHAQPGRERLDAGLPVRRRRRASPTRSGVRSPRRDQYSGLMPTGSRAATKRPSRPAITNANMPLRRRAPAARTRRAGAARPRCRSVVRICPRVQPGAHVLVVVDLAVADQERVAGGGLQRLRARPRRRRSTAAGGRASCRPT